MPTSADDVYFDAASTGTVTPVTAQAICRTLNTTGFTGTVTGTGTIIIHGGLTLNAGVTWSHSGSMDIRAASGSFTITTAGKTLGPTTFGFTGTSTATWTLGDAFTSSGAITVVSGTFDTANYNVTATVFSSQTTNTRTINFGSSTISVSAVGTFFTFATSTGLTFNAGTSTILSTSTADGYINVGGSAITFNNIQWSAATQAGVVRGVLGAGPATFNNFTAPGSTVASSTVYTFDSRTTINGTLSTTGTAGNRRVWFQGNTYGLAQTLTINSAPSLTDADFRDIYVVGTAAPISGTRVGNRGACRGITFSTPKTVYWNLAGAQNWSANGWAATSTGSPSTDNFPLPQDTATFTNAGSVTGTITLDTAIRYVPTVDMSGRTSAMTLGTSNATTVYGNWTNGSGTAFTGTATLTFSGGSTQTITSAGKTFRGGIIVDSYGGTVQLGDALDIGSNDITVTNGTFDTKNYNITARSLLSNNLNIRTINLGSSTLTLSGGSAVSFGITASPNLTFNCGTSQITLTTSSGGVEGGVTFYNVTASSTSLIAVNINGQNTFNNLTITAPASAGFAPVNFSANQTITGTLTVAGATPIRRIFVRSNTLGTTRTLTVGTLSATDCDFRDITIAGTAAGSSPTRAGDCGGNTGITFPAPKTVYWNLAGAQNWSATAWAPGSGGTPDINNFPLAQDTAVFDNTGSVTGTITINLDWNIGTFDASARTSAMTLTAGGNSARIHGDWKFGTGVTSSNSSGGFVFSKRGTQTITSNGVTFGSNITIDGVSGIVQLADALSILSTRNLLPVTGTFDAVSYNVTCGTMSYGDTVFTLKMGSGTWTLSGTGDVWYIAGSTSLTFYKNTANIVLSDTSTGTRQFYGAGLSYNKLTIGGTTGTSTLTILGNNQFTELASTKTVAHTIALGTTTQTFGKWTVTGTSGNVVTLTGTGTSHVLAGAATSGIDYLAMGSIGFSATSPGEFYAGANSTGTASAPVYRTATPTATTRYWVGGTGNWSSTTKWSTSSGGASGASVPTSLDNVVFDSASNATAYTATVDATSRCNQLTIAGPASGNVTFAGSSTLICHGNVTLPATGMTRTFTGPIILSGSSTGNTFTTNGVTISSNNSRINGVNCGWSLGGALNDGGSGSTWYVDNGSFDTAGYAVTLGGIASTNSNTRTLSFGSSTITVQGFNEGFANSINLTLNAGTSSISCTVSGATFNGGGNTFYNVSFTSTSAGTVTINGSNSFNNLSFTGITSSGLKIISVTANQTVTGTFTCSAGTNATMRHFVRSDTLGTTRTLTCAAVSLTDVDFRDITIAGAAAPASGTRIGDCKGNSGITFTGATTRYWNLAGGGNWSDTGWAASSGASPAANNFPLAQDTAVFEATGLNSGTTITINAAWNIGTINMSARTANTMTLSVNSTPTIYGNWINGTGITVSTLGVLTFSGRASQTITSAGKSFAPQIIIDSPSGSVSLLDAITIARDLSSALQITNGTFDAGTYNVTLSGASSGISVTNSNVRTLAFGSGTWSLSGSSTTFNASTSTNLTVTGTGTISLTSGSAKTFAGGGVAYTNITLNQGGAGTLTISGNNTFKDITNTYSATGATAITIGTTTQTVSQFTGTGLSGKVLTLSGTSASSPGTLILTGATKPNVDYLTITGLRAYSLDTTWYAGANSTNNGSLGWYFEAGAAPVSAVGGRFLIFMPI